LLPAIAAATAATAAFTAAAAATTATTAATEAAAATTTAATRATLTGPGFGHFHGAVLNHLAIEASDRSPALLVVRHLDKREAARLVCEFVAHDCRGHYLTVRRKRVTELLVGNLEGEIAHIESHIDRSSYLTSPAMRTMKRPERLVGTFTAATELAN
jgi:nitrous oxide reductase